MQFWPPDDEHMCSKHVEAWNKLIVKQKILCIKLVNYWDKYTEMHGQQNVKKKYKSKYVPNPWPWNLDTPDLTLLNKPLDPWGIS